MPGMCGTEVLQRAREIAPDVKRILLSAHADQPLVTMPAVNTGHVYRLLLKPWSHDELCQALTDALGQDPRAWSEPAGAHPRPPARRRRPGHHRHHRHGPGGEIGRMNLAPACQPVVLVVDDSPTIRARLVAFLAANGFRTLEAGTAAEARRLVRSARPDVVVLGRRAARS